MPYHSNKSNANEGLQHVTANANATLWDSQRPSTASSAVPPGAGKRHAKTVFGCEMANYKSNTNSREKAKSLTNVSTKKKKRHSKTSITGLSANASTQTQLGSQTSEMLVFTRDIGNRKISAQSQSAHTRMQDDNGDRVTSLESEN